MGIQGSQFIAEFDIASGFFTGVSTLVIGYLSTASLSIQAIRGSAYTEPSSAQQMRLVSSSASDSSAGTGSRTVAITWYDGSMNGPFVETVTMNGTTPVNTVATTMMFIEKLETLTVGSNGTNVGTISIQNIGGSTTFGTIVVGDGRTHWCHHYVAAGRICFIRGLNAGITGISGTVFLRVAKPLTPNAFEEQVTTQYRISSGVNTLPTTYDNLWVVGPARITAYAKPDVVTAGTAYADLDLFEL